MFLSFARDFCYLYGPFFKADVSGEGVFTVEGRRI